MAKTTSKSGPKFVCEECGWDSVKWVGRCGECQAWGTVAEVAAASVRAVEPGPVSAPAVAVTEITTSVHAAISSGFSEFDRVLGGGIVEGSVILLSGEPGVGKSTLLIEVAARCATHSPVLYISGEESSAQVSGRARRVGAVHPDLLVASETDLNAVVGHIEAVNPRVLIVDSVQTVSPPGHEGSAGGVGHVREVATALTRIAKQRGIATILVGHVTKDGSVAGPRTLEHLVDVVVQIEGDRHARLRLIRAQKNRFGPADEVGCFELSDRGLRELTDPSELFVSHRDNSVPGTALTVTLEGTRPLLAEVQALVDPTSQNQPRRVCTGLESGRIAMLLAVLERHTPLGLRAMDVYTATVGGMRLTEPAVDVAIAAALASAATRDCVVPGSVFIGEVGLAGELRRVPNIARRIHEAARLGCTRAIIPANSLDTNVPIPVVEAHTISDALKTAFA